MSTGLAVMRCQMLHRGHTRLIGRMCEDNDTAIVGLGSTGRSREPHDPWTVQERTQMLRNVYGERIRIVPLQDLGTSQGSTDWVDYVLDKCRKLGLSTPTRYYTGSVIDGAWYKSRFPMEDSLAGSGGIMYMIDRTETRIPSATELRASLAQRNDLWREWVPEVNWSLVEDYFPDEFRVKE